nr:hypothetical protein MZNIZDYX_MZNIZDYX_CDS_0023 [uncultured phage]CAI9752135.1 hypothetical protein GCSOEBMH_GCSOEBMH_CDS_0023 [uncultured phage]
MRWFFQLLITTNKRIMAHLCHTFDRLFRHKERGRSTPCPCF